MPLVLCQKVMCARTWLLMLAVLTQSGSSEITMKHKASINPKMSMHTHLVHIYLSHGVKCTGCNWMVTWARKWLNAGVQMGYYQISCACLKYGQQWGSGETITEFPQLHGTTEQQVELPALSTVSEEDGRPVNLFCQGVRGVVCLWRFAETTPVGYVMEQGSSSDVCL